MDRSLTSLFQGATGFGSDRRDCHLRKTIQGSTSEIEGGRVLRGKKNEEHGRTNRIRLERREAGLGSV